MPRKRREIKEAEGKEERKEVRVPRHFLISLNKLKRIDSKLALFVQKQWREKMLLYNELLDASESEAMAWEENNSLKIRASILERKLNEKEKEIVRLKSELQTKIERISNLEGQVRSYAERVGVAEQLYATLIQQIIFLKKKIAEVAAEGLKEMLDERFREIEITLKKMEEILKSKETAPVVIPAEAGGGGGK